MGSSLKYLRFCFKNVKYLFIFTLEKSSADMDKKCKNNDENK